MVSGMSKLDISSMGWYYANQYIGHWRTVCRSTGDSRENFSAGRLSDKVSGEPGFCDFFAGPGFFYTRAAKGDYMHSEIFSKLPPTAMDSARMRMQA